MSEREPSSERPHFSREQVIAAFRKFVDRGFAAPEDLPLDDPEVIAANEIFYSWVADVDQQAKRRADPEADFELTLSKTTIFVDAGFDDPSYLEEIAYDLLDKDYQEALGAGLPDAAGHIRSKIEEIKARIPS